MEKIQNLLNEVENIRQEAERLHLKSYKNGEEFDVFSVVGLWDEEVKLHSAIIAELLDPHGSHGAGDYYLKQFFHILECDDFPLDANKVNPNHVIKERYIGPKTETTGGRVDIIIEDGDYALIIENKPGNVDQENQMLRYRNFADKKYKKSILVYLTKDGRKASFDSTGGRQFDYKRLSFNEILSWLDNCSCKSSPNTNVKAVINQYKLHLKKIMGNTMDDNNSKKLLSLLTQENNVFAVKEILCKGEDWLKYIVKTYLFEPLGEYAESKNMHYVIDGTLFYMYKDGWSSYGVFLWPDKNEWSNFRVGVSLYGNAQPDDPQNGIFEDDFSKMICLSENPDKNWPYGWEYLPSDMQYFSADNADKILKSEVLEWVKQKFDEILNEIQDNNLRMP